MRGLSRMRITQRRLLSHVQQQGSILSIELERQHGDRPFYHGPLHVDMDVYFTPDKPNYKWQTSKNYIYNDQNPCLSVLVGFLEQIGQGIIFNAGTAICSLNCTKKYTTDKEPYLTFSISELKKDQNTNAVQTKPSIANAFGGE